MKKFKTLVCIIPTLTIALTFFGCGNLIPYSLQPSYWQFKNMCELDPEIYQAKGDKLDEEYYNKVLAYFDTSLEKLDWDYIQKNLFLNDSGEYVYQFNKFYDRIEVISNVFFKNNREAKTNIKKISFYVNWRDLRPRLAGNEGTGFYLSGDRLDCSEFNKEIK